MQNHETHVFQSLTPEVIIAAIESAGFICDARILPLNSYENRVYQVGIEGASPLILKFYRPQRWSDAQILEEHHFVAELADRDIPAVPALVLGENSTLAHYQTYRFAAYPKIAGRAPELDDAQTLEIIGRYLGRIHAVGSIAHFSARPSLSYQHFAADSADYLQHQNFIPIDLLAAYSAVAEQLITHLAELFERIPFQTLRLHGDCHLSNILWPEQIPRFVDFDDARNGPAVQDLWMLLSGTREEQAAQLSQILIGYRQFNDFDPRELLLIEPLRTMRIMNYVAWLARRWEDPAFQQSFPWFNTQKFWEQHILDLREQQAALHEPPLLLVE